LILKEEVSETREQDVVDEHISNFKGKIVCSSSFRVFSASSSLLDKFAKKWDFRFGLFE
jgi:hypothetical protein